MKLYHTLGGQYLIHGKEFPKGTIVLCLDNGGNYIVINQISTIPRKNFLFQYTIKRKRYGIDVK